jgi:hypothetical protein
MLKAIPQILLAQDRHQSNMSWDARSRCQDRKTVSPIFWPSRIIRVSISAGSKPLIVLFLTMVFLSRLFQIIVGCEMIFVFALVNYLINNGLQE